MASNTRYDLIPEIAETIKSCYTDGVLLIGNGCFLEVGVCEYLLIDGLLTKRVTVEYGALEYHINPHMVAVVDAYLDSEL